MALLDTSTLTLQLSQFIEPGRSYTTTLLCLDIACPQSVVVVAGAHDVFAAAGVNSAVGAAGFSQVPLGRSNFDDTQGIQQVRRVGHAAAMYVLFIMARKAACLCACNMLGYRHLISWYGT